MSKYNKTTALVLCVLLGYLGIHHFYVNRNKMGILYLFTCGLFGVGWIIDILLILINQFKDSEGHYITSAKKTNNFPVHSQPTSAQPTPTNYPVTSGNQPNSSYTDSNKNDNSSKIHIPSKIDGQPLAYKYFDVDICVISGQEPDYKAIIDRLSVDPIVTTLEIESENQYDNKAIRVMFNDSKLGYLYKGTIKDMAYDYLNTGRPIFSCLSSIDLDSNEMKMFIGFYYKKTYNNEVSFKLTSNNNKDMQETLACSSVGDELTFSYDYEKGKYCFTNYDDVGYAPKSKNELLEEIEDDYYASIDEINTDDNGKYFVVVKLEYN